MKLVLSVNRKLAYLIIIPSLICHYEYTHYTLAWINESLRLVEPLMTLILSFGWKLANFVEQLLKIATSSSQLELLE